MLASSHLSCATTESVTAYPPRPNAQSDHPTRAETTVETEDASSPLPRHTFKELRGRIIDSHGQPVPGAKVDINDPSWDDFDNSMYMTVLEGAIACPIIHSRFSFDQTTGPDGRFEWRELEKSLYSVTVTHEHFQTRTISLPTGKACQTIMLQRTAAH